jgi:hypothetical protein
MTTQKSKKRTGVYDSMASCASAEGIDQAMLKFCKESGCPGFEGSRVRYRMVQEWMAKNEDKLAEFDKGDSSHWRTEKWKWDAKTSKLKYEKADEILWDGDSISAWYEARHAAMRALLYNKLENEFPMKCLGLSVEDMRIAGRKMADEILNEFRQYKTKPDIL